MFIAEMELNWKRTGYIHARSKNFGRYSQSSVVWSSEKQALTEKYDSPAKSTWPLGICEAK